MLLCPVIFSNRALTPTATLFIPVVLLLKALAPTRVLLVILPPPSPTQTPLNTESCVEHTDPVTLKVCVSQVKLLVAKSDPLLL